MCNAVDRLSKAFDTYYQDQVANNPKNTKPCDFNGAAQKQSPKLSSSCGAAVSQAGPAGTGVISSVPSGTGSGSSSATASKKSAGSVVVPSFSFGLLQLAAYVTVAVLTGAGMVLL